MWILSSLLLLGLTLDRSLSGALLVRLVEGHGDIALPSLLLDAANDCDDDSNADQCANEGEDPPKPDQVVNTVIIVF